MSDNETEMENIDTFNFDKWCGELNLTRKVCQILRQEDLVTKEALSLIQEMDLKQIGLTMGAIKVIIADISKWNSKERVDDNAASGSAGKSPEAVGELLSGAGKTFDCLLNNPSENVHTNTPTYMSGPFMDPRTILTMKAQNRKVTHITQFLTEKTKRRRQNRKREYVLRSGTDNDETIVLRTAEDHPYLGIFIEEWGAANMRLLNHLLCTGQLQREAVEYYLAYTTKIFEFAENYDWNSILNFDYNYRELQAEHGFRWGTFSPHMEMQTLIPKRSRAQNQASQSTAPRQMKEDCRIFKAKGNCPFGQKCRYRHPDVNPPDQGQAKNL